VKVIDLTMLLDHDGMADEVFPIATHYYLGPKYHADKGITLGSETGTCITLPSTFASCRKTMRLHEVAPEKLTLRPMSVLNVPKGSSEPVEEDDLKRAMEEGTAQSGDAILIRTGWGDNQLHTLRGDRYVLQSPYLTLKAAELLAAKMWELDSDLLLLDTALIGLPNNYLIPEWCSLLPRAEPWPSPEARVYLHLYTPEKAKADFAAEIALAEAGIMTVRKLVNCRAVVDHRPKVIVAPLQIIRGTASTCRVAVLEEG
jgi:kynurenine formamidase